MIRASPLPSPAVPEFAAVVLAHWNSLFGASAAPFSIAVQAALPPERRLMLLQGADGRERVALTPAMAAALSLESHPCVNLVQLRQRLDEAGIALHGADSVFYVEAAASLADSEVAGLRRLSAADAAAFAEFQAAASEQDRDDAYVELDHWAVFGVFVDERLVCAASAYPWGESAIADLGVLTLAPFRGRGLARVVVRAMAQHARAAGLEPQYRCQQDNAASLALARAAGLGLFGHWDVISTVSAA